MSLQYLTDHSGRITAVVIPISEWESIVSRHAVLKLLEDEQPLQYLSDYSGKPTAIVIPISEWERIVQKHADLKELNPPLSSNARIPLMKEFENLLTEEEGESLLQYVDQSRNEWGTDAISKKHKAFID